MEATKEELARQGFDGHALTHEYADGSVDGEIVVSVGRGQKAVTVMQYLESAFGTQNMRGFWFSVGIRFGVAKESLEQAEARYDRHKGMHETWMNWRKMYRNDPGERTAQMIDPFGTMEHRIIPAIEETYDRKVQQVIVRIHWNPENTKPKR